MQCGIERVLDNVVEPLEVLVEDSDVSEYIHVRACVQSLVSAEFRWRFM